MHCFKITQQQVYLTITIEMLNIASVPVIVLNSAFVSKLHAVILNHFRLSNRYTMNNYYSTKKYNISETANF
jgi:hypothetical protein